MGPRMISASSRSLTLGEQMASARPARQARHRGSTPAGYAPRTRGTIRSALPATIVVGTRIRRQALLERREIPHEHALVGGERAPRGRGAQPARGRLQVGLLDLEQIGDTPAYARRGQGEARPGHDRRADQFAGQRPRQPVVERYERGAVGRRGREHQPAHAVGMLGGQPRRHRATEAVADDGGARRAGGVERVQRGRGVSGQVGRCAARAPSGPVDGQRHAPAARSPRRPDPSHARPRADRAGTAPARDVVWLMAARCYWPRRPRA